MNPPFIGWEALDSREQDIVENALGDYKVGRADTYLAFLLRAAQSLKSGGVLAAVVPFPFFYAEAASKVRDYLYGPECRIRMIGRFRGFETFEGMVETAAIVLSKSQNDSSLRIVVAEKNHAEQAIRMLRSLSPRKELKRAGFEIRNVRAEDIRREGGILHNVADMDFVDELRASTLTQVSDLFSVRLGIRGIGADRFQKVLLLTGDEFAQLVQTENERAFFRPVADRIIHGRIVASDYIFYPYDTDGTLLITNEEQLAAIVPDFYRAKLLPARQAMLNRHTKRQWWEADRPRREWLAAIEPRLVSQEFGREGNFAFDAIGRFAVVGGIAWYWKGTPQTALTYGYLALFNSRVFHRVLNVYCPKLQGLQCRLEKRFVDPVPLPDITFGADEMAAIGRLIHAGKHYDEEALDNAVMAAYRQGRTTHISQAKAIEHKLSKRFALLAKTWIRETSHISTVGIMANHPAYQEIILMGWPVVPLILDELRHRPDFWFKALREITKENPVPPSHAGNVSKMAKAWVQWGKKKGFIK